MSERKANNASAHNRKSPAIKRPQMKSRLLFSADQRKPRPQSRSSRDSSPGKWEEAPEMRSLREQLYENPDLSQLDNSTLDSLFCSLREYAHQEGGKGDYDEALRASNLSDAVREELRVRNPVMVNSSLNSPQARSAQFEDAWQKKFEEFDHSGQTRISALKAEQDDSVAEFERVWRDEMPRQYRKASVHLLQLRRIEKCLAICNEFDKAKAIHQEAETIAAHEWEMQQANLLRDYQIARTRLFAKHEAVMNQLRHTIAHERSILTQQYERERTALTNRSLVVDVKRKEAEKAKNGDRIRRNFHGCSR